jgi:glucose/arabinose dehydrogenase
VKSIRGLSWLLGLGLGLCVSQPAVADDCTPLTTELVASGFTNPLLAVSPPGDTERLFIVEQYTGQVRIINLSNGSINPTPFLDINPLVIDSGNERGFLGLAFHPDYANNRYFFVHYNDNAGTTTIARYRTMANDPNQADPNSAKIIFTHAQPFSNHNAGMLAFGPNDGYLYFGLGDGGSGNDPGNRAQNGQVLLGKMLRLDVDVDPELYLIPPTNPFVNDPNVLDEIWAIGLRNPWRFSFDQANGDMYIGDVGQGAREEIDYAPASSAGGENWGWRCMEGFSCTGLSGCTCNSPQLSLPIIDHGRADAFAIIGGNVYRSRRIPGLRGTYFYADNGTNRLFSLRVVNGQATEARNRTTELQPIGGGLTSITSFGQDGAGEVYIVARGGRIFRIVPDGLAHGDMNGDGAVDAFDIEPFVIALTDRNAYNLMFPGINADQIGDTNCDGVLDAFDIEGFVGYMF